MNAFEKCCHLEEQIKTLQARVRQRDARIAELEHLSDDAIDRARAEVPEWCAQYLRALACEQESDCSCHGCTLGRMLTPDQLRACGIEP